MMTADKDRLDFLLMETFELFCHIGSCRVAGQDAVVEVASYQEEIWLVVKSKVDQHVEAVLKVSYSFEPLGTILNAGGVELVVSCEKDVNCHEGGSYRFVSIISPNRFQGRRLLRRSVDDC